MTSPIPPYSEFTTCGSFYDDLAGITRRRAAEYQAENQKAKREQTEGVRRNGMPLSSVFKSEEQDNWKHRSAKMTCKTCMCFVPKKSVDGSDSKIGRCRRHAPTLSGWPATFETDWCLDHKIDEGKI